MWDLPGPGMEPGSPALAGGFLTTAPQGKPTSLASCAEKNDQLLSQPDGLFLIHFSGASILVLCFRGHRILPRLLETPVVDKLQKSFSRGLELTLDCILKTALWNMPLFQQQFITMMNCFFDTCFVLAGASLIQMVKNLPAVQETRFCPWLGKIP